MSMENYKPLGNYIMQCNERNVDCRYGAEELRGINNEGKVFPSKANIIGVSFHTYKIAHKGYFIYNPARLDIGSISCLQEDTAIFSQMYVVFKVKEEFKDILLTEYLWLWLKRKEFFRYVAFINFGSVREMFTFEDMCNVLLPVPPISEQRRIVNEYQTVERRIANNEALIQKLEETAQAIYHHTFVEGIDVENLPEGWRVGTLKDFGQVVTGTTPSCENPEEFGDKYNFVTPGDFTDNKKYILYAERGISEVGHKKLKNRFIPQESVMVTCIGSNMGLVCINGTDCLTNQQINSIVPDKSYYKDFLYYYLHSIKETLQGEAAGSSAVPLLNKSQFESLKAIKPPSTLLESFSIETRPINETIKLLSQENHHLRTLLTLLTSKLS